MPEITHLQVAGTAETVHFREDLIPGQSRTGLDECIEVAALEVGEFVEDDSRHIDLRRSLGLGQRVGRRLAGSLGELL